MHKIFYDHDIRPGITLFDYWTMQNVTIVAGAQSRNHLTVLFPDGTIAAVDVRYLTSRTFLLPTVKENNQ